jgi:hypothetical protein
MKRTNTMIRVLLWGLVLLLTFTLTGQASAQGTCVPPLKGLVSWWPGDGDTNDIQGNNLGTLQNGATFAPGLVGQAFSLDGVNNFIQVSDNANLKLSASESLSLDAWVKTAKLGTQRIVSKQAEDSTSFYFLRLTPNGTAQFAIADNFPTSSVTITGTTNVADGTFHHIAGVRDKTAGTVKLYVDGVLEASAPDTTAGAITGGTNSLTIGTLFFTILGPQPEFFQGLIDEVEIYNRALSAAEIQAVFNAGSAGKCTLDRCLLETSQCQQDLAAADQEIQAFEAQVNALTAQNAQLQQQLQNLTGGVGGGLTILQNDFRAMFNNPTFVIPGATLLEQYQNLITAILHLNQGRKMGIYTNLGGKP